MFQYISTILCVHFRNSSEGKSTSGMVIIEKFYRSYIIKLKSGGHI